jgi:hypothetical protein
VPAALELLCDCVINPAFKPEELEEQKGRLQLLLANPDVQLTILTEVRSWRTLACCLWCPAPQHNCCRPARLLLTCGADPPLPSALCCVTANLETYAGCS